MILRLDNVVFPISTAVLEYASINVVFAVTQSISCTFSIACTISGCDAELAVLRETAGWQIVDCQGQWST